MLYSQKVGVHRWSDRPKGKGSELARFAFDPQFDPNVTFAIWNLSRMALVSLSAAVRPGPFRFTRLKITLPS